MSQRFIATLIAMEVRAVANGFSVASVISKSAQNAFGVDILPTEDEVDATLDELSGLKPTAAALDAEFYAKFTKAELAADAAGREPPVVLTGTETKGEMIAALVARDEANALTDA